MDVSYRNDAKDNDADEVPRLIQAWVNERCCPDILFYEQDLVENVQELVNSQKELVKKSRASRSDAGGRRKRRRRSSTSDPFSMSSHEGSEFTATGSSEFDEDHDRNKGPKSDFACLLLETEVDRILFYLRSYLRCRIRKIQKYALFVKHDAAARQKLSSHERKFAETIVDAESRLRYDLFAKNVPEPYREIVYVPRAGDADGAPQQGDLVNEVMRPNPEAYVFVRIVHDLGPRDVGGGSETILSKNDIVVGPYVKFEQMLDTHECELI